MLDKETVELILLLEKLFYAGLFLFLGVRVAGVILWSRRMDKKHQERRRAIAEARVLMASMDGAKRALGRELMLEAWRDDPDMQRKLRLLGGESKDSLNN